MIALKEETFTTYLVTVQVAVDVLDSGLGPMRGRAKRLDAALWDEFKRRCELGDPEDIIAARPIPRVERS